METLDEVREYWGRLDYCGCYTQEIKDILEKATELHYFIPSVHDKDEGITVVSTPDGVWTLIESQDYTGHGCRCGSSVQATEAGPFKTLSDALRLGATFETVRKILGTSPY